MITLWVLLSCFMIFILFMILMILGLSNSGPGYVASPAPKIGSEPRFLGSESILGEGKAYIACRDKLFRLKTWILKNPKISKFRF